MTLRREKIPSKLPVCQLNTDKSLRECISLQGKQISPKKDLVSDQFSDLDFLMRIGYIRIFWTGLNLNVITVRNGLITYRVFHDRIVFTIRPHLLGDDLPIIEFCEAEMLHQKVSEEGLEHFQLNYELENYVEHTAITQIPSETHICCQIPLLKEFKVAEMK
jgi:hypothetical protein